MLGSRGGLTSQFLYGMWLTPGSFYLFRLKKTADLHGVWHMGAPLGQVHSLN